MGVPLFGWAAAALVHLACLYRGGSADVCFLIMCMSSKCVESLAHAWLYGSRKDCRDG